MKKLFWLLALWPGLAFGQQLASPGGGGGSSELSVGTTPIVGGVSGNCLYDNAGKLGEQNCNSAGLTPPVVINGAPPTYTLNVLGTSVFINTTSFNPRGLMSQQVSSDGSSAHFSGLKARGTVASPTVVSPGDYVADLAPYPYDGSNYIINAAATWQVTPGGTITTNSVPVDFVIQPGAAGGSDGTEAARFQSNGLVSVTSGGAAHSGKLAVGFGSNGVGTIVSPPSPYLQVGVNTDVTVSSTAIGAMFGPYLNVSTIYPVSDAVIISAIQWQASTSTTMLLEVPNINTGVTQPLLYDVSVGAALGAGQFTKRAAFNTQTISLGSIGSFNTTHVLLGTTTIPSTNYAIYDATGYPSFHQGPVGIGTQPTGAALQANISAPSSGGFSFIVYSTGTTGAPALATTMQANTAYDSVTFTIPSGQTLGDAASLVVPRIANTKSGTGTITNSSAILIGATETVGVNNYAILSRSTALSQFAGALQVTSYGAGVVASNASGILSSNTSLKPGANNHYSYGGSSPALSACGTSPTIDTNASDSSGRVTVGSTATGCVITFNVAYSTFNHCKATSQGAVSGITYSYTLSAITIAASILGGDVIDYACDGV